MVTDHDAIKLDKWQHPAVWHGTDLLCLAALVINVIITSFCLGNVALLYK